MKNPLHDLTKPEGFCIALSQLLRVRRNGLLWGGNPCSRPLFFFPHRIQQTTEVLRSDNFKIYIIYIIQRCSRTCYCNHSGTGHLCSWIWISASTTKRREVGVMGDETLDCVKTANCICARFALLALVAVIYGIYWCVFQLRYELHSLWFFLNWLNKTWPRRLVGRCLQNKFLLQLLVERIWARNRYTSFWIFLGGVSN